MTVKEQARRLLIYANGASARHKPSAHKRREAQLAVGKALMLELRSKGFHYTKEMERALK